MLSIKWILIVLFSLGNSNQGVAMQEFDTNRACVAASEKIIQIKRSYGGMTFACVEKYK